MKVADFIVRTLDLFYLKPVRRIIPHRTFLYLVCGAGNTALGWALYFVFFNYVMEPAGFVNLGFVQMSPHIATLFIEFPITFWTGFWLNRNVAFSDSELGARTQAWRYIVSTAGAFLLNYALLKIFVEALFIAPPIAKILTDVVVVVYSYIMQRYFSFRTTKK